MTARKPRKIILLSDGTGNSSIARDKSNVWRIYTSLELGSDTSGEYEQVAFYDDGVGTSGFRPLKLLGGVFGVGLSRNLRQLYADLCRHYQPGDKIYIFGFSRGAFTARILAHFIESCGIVDTSKMRPGSFRNLDDMGAKKEVSLNSEEGFARTIKDAYNSYRQGYWRRSSKYFFPRFLDLLNRFLRRLTPGKKVVSAQTFKELYSHDQDPGKPVIEFLGVWDTVDAFGLPIDELADFLDKWIYPYKFKSQLLGDGVGHAVQALAIDDERHTFHPILWRQETPKDKERILQVWFTGMHSDVGGSYPEDNLAYISLCWMVDQALQHGLVFDQQTILSYRKQQQPTGTLHDSRRGAAVLYRYKPRNIYKLCKEEIVNHQGTVILHHSVLDRIGSINAGYAPAGIPKNFHVYIDTGAIDDRSPGSPYYEEEEKIKTRHSYLSTAEDYIAWGRFTYFCMLTTFLYLLVFPLLNPPVPGMLMVFENADDVKIPNSFLEHGLVLINCIADILVKICTALFQFLENDLTRRWTDAWQQNLRDVGIAVLIFAGFFIWGKLLAKAVQKHAEQGWSHARDAETIKTNTAISKIFLAASNNVRTSGSFSESRRWFSKTLFPLAFFALLLFVIAMPVSRYGLTPLTEKIDPCKVAQAPVVGARLALNEFAKITLQASSPCITANVDLDVGRTYEIAVTDMKDWIDNGDAATAGETTYPATLKGLDGIFTGLRPGFVAGMLVRRNLTMPWFVLTGEIGRDSGHVFPINKMSFKFKPMRSGPLYLYVNDALKIYGDKNWWEFYDNNTGTATLTITRVE